MMKSKQRIAITGIGMVSPLGNDTASTWRALMNRQSGIDFIKSFDASKFPAQIGSEVKNFSLPIKIADKKLQRQAIGYVQFAISAAEEALQDAGIKPTEKTASRWGLTAGCGMISAAFDYWLKFQPKFAATGEVDTVLLGQKGVHSISASEVAKMQTNTGLGLIAKLYNIRGLATAVHTACASGGQGIGLGLKALLRDDCDYVLAGGFDSMLNPMSLAGFCLLGALSTYNCKSASRPFDLTRNGFVLGEGATFLVLEKWESAVARGAKIYAELAGEGNSLSCYRITDSHPSGDGAIQAIEQALETAGLTADQIDYINAHGTSTKMNDMSETNAIKAVFKERAKKLVVSSTKSQVGHLISAAGAIEGAFAALAIHHGTVPMTMNLQTPDPDCDLDYCTEGPRNLRVRAALSTSFGFGGTNNVLAFKHPEF
jgi:3-oxoacyl-(acyl-carrier-protein) synthase